MPETIGYMLTWTTYGTWLQGAKHGYVRHGVILGPDNTLVQANKRLMKSEAVKLSKAQRKIVEAAILAKAAQLGQSIRAIAVSSNHVHIVAEHLPIPIGKIVRHYKGATHSALRSTGLQGRLWTKGFDRRFCFDKKSFRNRIDYVNRQKDK